MRTFLLALAACFALAAARAEFPEPRNSETVPGEPMPAAEATAKWQLPEGFRATLFAGEPEVRNPIAMTWDARGRLWVAENFTYAERGVRFDLTQRDRVLIFEDKDGDGTAETRTVFADNLQGLTSVEVGHGGVWLLCPPRLLFVPDRDGDGQPDSAPETVLDGFTVALANHHNMANGLRWGPDGCLYGRCGASCPGEVGRPGTPVSERVPLRGTMWRFHPQRQVFEALSSGTTNPWGHDWDAHGELFFINTVNGHLWHGITGAHFVRPHTIDPNPHAYVAIDQHADHWHFDTGKDWTASRDGAANSLGGGHAHSGVMIYQGDNWPAALRGKLFTLNFHGRRMNTERLERLGGGYVGRHEADICLSGDPWFRGVDLGSGPDGGVFVLDWSDTGECHDNTGVHRQSGRIFKITNGVPTRVEVGDLAKKSATELAALHLHANDWFVRQARRILSERALAGDALPEARAALTAQLDAKDADAALRLRALWTLRLIGGADDGKLRSLLADRDEHLRVWAIRLLTDALPLDTTLSRRAVQTPALDGALLAEFTRLSSDDPSGLVRLALASTLQRLPAAQRPALAAPLLAHAEDAADHDLPAMLWFGLIPLGESDPLALAKLGADCQLPLTRRCIARRLGEEIEKNPAPLDLLLSRAAEAGAAFQNDVLTGLAEALAGWRKAPKPAGWDALAAKLGTDPALAPRLQELGALFGDGRALDEVKRLALDGKAEALSRRRALETLLEMRPPDLRPICEKLLGDRAVATIAARGLAQFDDPKLGKLLADKLRSVNADDRTAFIGVLTSRPAWAGALLDALAAGTVARGELTAFHARQIAAFDDPALSAKLRESWGELRTSDAAKKELIASWKVKLTDHPKPGDARAGRVTFQQTCAVCHTLYGEGGAIGPDLTGSDRHNLDYLLENIGDPSAVVTADFRLTTLTLKDGRVLSGMIAARTPKTLTVRSLTESVTFDRAEVVKTEDSAVSMMPEGLLQALSEQQVRDLFAYLTSDNAVR